MSSVNDIWERLLKSAKNQNILGIIGVGVGIIGLGLALSQYIRAQPPTPTPQEPIQEQPPTTPVEEPIQPPTPTPTPTPTTPLSAQLSMDKTTAVVGEPIRWYVTITGGIGPYTVKLVNSNTKEIYATMKAQ